MNKLTKKALLMDTSDTQIIEVSGYSEKKLKKFPDERVTEDGKVKLDIRPLNDFELSVAQEIITEGMDIDNKKLKSGDISKLKKLRDEGASDEKIAEEMGEEFDVDINVTKLKKKRKESNYQVAAFALSCNGEEWGVEDVQKLPPGVPSQIAEKAREISTLQPKTAEDERKLENFRE